MSRRQARSDERQSRPATKPAVDQPRRTATSTATTSRHQDGQAEEANRRRRRGGGGGAEHETAGERPKQSDVRDTLADPDIRVGRKSYRSFYVDDEAFARFRAAIHWSSRRPDAVDEVPENMSVAVETWMLNTARDLERRYNDGQVFRIQPKPTRRPRTKK